MFGLVENVQKIDVRNFPSLETLTATGSATPPKNLMTKEVVKGP